MDKLPGISFFVLVIILGVVLITGAARKWRWLIDPPEKYWYLYSQSFMKKVLGERAVLLFTYGMGMLCIAFGFYVIVRGIWFE